MKRMILFAVFAIVFLPHPARCLDTTELLTVRQFLDYELTGGAVVLNNFSISEDSAFLSDSLKALRVTFSAKNKENATHHFGVMLVGASDKEILWSLSLEPGMSLLGKNTTETVRESIYIKPGTLRSTKTIWMRIIGDW